MRYTLHINQAGAKAAGLLGKVDLIDLALFDAFKDFANSNKCEKKFEQKRVWFWISYKMLVDEIPFVPIKTKDAVYRRMKKLAAVGVIDFHPDNQKTGKSFFAWGEKYDFMISEYKEVPTDEKPHPYGQPSVPPTDEKPYNHSTNNHSTNTNKQILSEKSDGEKPPVSKRHQYPQDFQDFWKLYNFTAGSKKRAADRFHKLTAEEKEEALSGLPRYIHTTTTENKTGKDFIPKRCHAEFYLSGRRWEPYLDDADAEKNANAVKTEWDEAYDKYLEYSKTKWPEVMDHIAYLSKKDFIAYKTTKYVAGLTSMGDQIQLNEFLRSHDRWNNKDPEARRFTTVWPYHLERFAEKIKQLMTI